MLTRRHRRSARYAGALVLAAALLCLSLVMRVHANALPSDLDTDTLEQVAALTYLSASQPQTTDALLTAARFNALLRQQPEMGVAAVADATSELRALLAEQGSRWQDLWPGMPGPESRDPIGRSLGVEIAGLGHRALDQVAQLDAMLALYAEPGLEPLREPLAVPLRAAALDAAGWVWAELYGHVQRRPELLPLAQEITGQVIPVLDDEQSLLSHLNLDPERDLNVAAVRDVRDRLDEPMGLLALTLRDLAERGYQTELPVPLDGTQPESDAGDASSAEVSQAAYSADSAQPAPDSEQTPDPGPDPEGEFGAESSTEPNPVESNQVQSLPRAQPAASFVHDWARAHLRRYLLQPRAWPAANDSGSLALRCARLVAAFNAVDEIDLLQCLSLLDHDLGSRSEMGNRPAAEAMLAQQVADYAVQRSALLTAVDPVLGRRAQSFAPRGPNSASENSPELASTDQPAPFGRARGRSGLALQQAEADARLWLLAESLEGYREQPFRDPLRNELAVCTRLGMRPDVGPPAPLTRDQFRSCLNSFANWALSAALRPEAAGDLDGPFASAQLSRELELPPWQRVNYLRGFQGSELAACEEPDGEVINPLEWSYAARAWVAFVRAFPWHDPGDGPERLRAMGVAGLDLLDAMLQPCDREDGVARVLTAAVENYRAQLAAFADALEARRQLFRERELAAGADVDLVGAADQASNYRPEGQEVRPCAQAVTCGVSGRFSASRALFGLFPSPYLLADQTRLGSVKLCYDNVQWVERRQAPSASGDARLAAYYGKLSFELRGYFDYQGASELVFARRLTGREEYEYLLGDSSEEVLQNACPMDLVGTSVVSELPEGRGNLVPNRLTYLTSARTDPARLFTVHWEQGEEWRDQFISDERVEVLAQPQFQTLMEEVALHLSRLKAKLDRELYRAMMGVPGSNGQEDASLNQATVDLSVAKALLNRQAVLWAPQSTVRNQALRASLYGENQLMDRDDIAIFRGLGNDPVALPAEMRRRMESALQAWLPFIAGLQGFELDQLVVNTLVQLKTYRPTPARPPIQPEEVTDPSGAERDAALR